MKLSENTVLVTGATSGIGRAFAEQLADRGSNVIACGRRAERLEELEAYSPRIATRQCNLADAAQRTELADWVIREHPSLNILINNAGIQLAVDLRRPIDLEAVETEIATNLLAPIHLTSLLLPHLSEQQTAAVVNVSSGLAFTPIAFMPVYCATKAALHSLTLSLRHQLRSGPVRVFEIAPPSVDTELGHQRREDNSQSHGGMPIEEFIAAAMKAIAEDRYEAPIGPAENMHKLRDALFDRMNQS